MPADLLRLKSSRRTGTRVRQRPCRAAKKMAALLPNFPLSPRTPRTFSTSPFPCCHLLRSFFLRSTRPTPCGSRSPHPRLAQLVSSPRLTSAWPASYSLPRPPATFAFVFFRPSRDFAGPRFSSLGTSPPTAHQRMRLSVVLTCVQTTINHWSRCFAHSSHRGLGRLLGAFEEVCLG
jgi:hypothetical protein